LRGRRELANIDLMQRSHDKLIASAAKKELGPLGFARKGRSRTWIADHGWWATIVEFQPSSWSKGSYLNVAAHWLWSCNDTLSFDFGGRLKEYVQFESDEQFSEAAAYLATLAATEALKLSSLFVSVPVAATILMQEAASDTRGGWAAFNAGMAAGIVGMRTEAKEMFARVTNGFAPPTSALALAAARMSPLVDHPSVFTDEVNAVIASHRTTLALPALPERPL